MCRRVVLMQPVDHGVHERRIVKVDELGGGHVRSRLVIVDDHDLVARVLAETLRGRGSEVTVVAPCDPQRLVATVDALAPDLVLHDLDLGAAGDGVGHVRALAAAGHRVLMVTGVVDPVARGRCVEAGAIGIIDKARSFGDLVAAIDQALGGHGEMAAQEREEHLAVLRRHREQQRRRLDVFSSLTPREAEVLGELMAGRTVDEIAAAFTVSVTTVRSHVRAVLSKLGVHSQLAAVGLARDRGWPPPDPPAS